MAKVDLHVHSVGSRQNVRYEFLKIFGSVFRRFREAYTDPEEIYDICLEKGMDFVTITDHNNIRKSLELHRNHPNDTFVGCEYLVSVKPVKKWKLKSHFVEILVYNQDLIAHRALIRKRREGLEKFVKFCKDEKLPYVLAHPSWPIYPRPRMRHKHLEDWLQYFDVIEARNGSMLIENIHHQELVKEFGKAGTGGSDAHSIVGLGETWTESPAKTVNGFLEDLLEGCVKYGGEIGSLKKFKAHTQQNVNDFLRYEFGHLIPRFKRNKGSSEEWKRMMYELKRYGKVLSVIPAKLFLIPFNVQVYWKKDQKGAEKFYLEFWHDHYKDLYQEKKYLLEGLSEEYNWIERMYAKLLANNPLTHYNKRG